MFLVSQIILLDCYEWVDSSSGSFLLTINAAVIYMFYDLWIYIINGFKYVFLMGRRLGTSVC